MTNSLGIPHKLSTGPLHLHLTHAEVHACEADHAGQLARLATAYPRD